MTGKKKFDCAEYETGAKSRHKKFTSRPVYEQIVTTTEITLKRGILPLFFYANLLNLTREALKSSRHNDTYKQKAL